MPASGLAADQDANAGVAKVSPFFCFFWLVAWMLTEDPESFVYFTMVYK